MLAYIWPMLSLLSMLQSIINSLLCFHNLRWQATFLLWVDYLYYLWLPLKDNRSPQPMAVIIAVVDPLPSPNQSGDPLDRLCFDVWTIPFHRGIFHRIDHIRVIRIWALVNACLADEWCKFENCLFFLSLSLLNKWNHSSSSSFSFLVYSHVSKSHQMELVAVVFNTKPTECKMQANKYRLEVQIPV